MSAENTHAEAITAPPSEVEALLAERSTQLLTHLDWDAFIDDTASQKPTPIDANTLAHLLSEPTLRQGKKDDLVEKAEFLGHAWEELQAYHKTPEQNTNDQSAEYIADGNIVQVIDDWFDSTFRAMRYVSNARYDVLKNSLPLSQMSRLQYLAEIIGLDGKRDTAMRPPGIIADAIERAIANQMLKFDRYDQAYVRAEQEYHPNEPLISGADALTATTGIKDAPAWITRELDSLPVWLSSGIDFVEVYPDLALDKNPDEKIIQDHSTTKKELFTTGGWNQQKNTLALGARHNFFTKHMQTALLEGQDEQTTKTELQAEITCRIRGTIIHEVTHYAHNNILPIHWLREWCMTIQNDRKAVSSYVEQTRRTQSEQVADEEDLCETANEYKLRPATLAFKSRDRFTRMQELFGGYDTQALARISDFINHLPNDIHEVVDQLIDLNRSIAEEFRPASRPPALAQP